MRVFVLAACSDHVEVTFVEKLISPLKFCCSSQDSNLDFWHERGKCYPLDCGGSKCSCALLHNNNRTKNSIGLEAH